MNPSPPGHPTSAAAAEHSLPVDRSDPNALLLEYHRTRSLETRNEIVLLYSRLVHYVVRQFNPGGGQTVEDLTQVGYMGLINAIERFDPNSGASFVTFAMPTIVGVIKRYLRDQAWSIKAPRRIRELGMRLRKDRARLEHNLGRAPTVEEMAEETGLDPERLVEAMEVEQAYQPTSLDAAVQVDGVDQRCTLGDALGGTDSGLTTLELRVTVETALNRLNERQRAIIYHRFFENLPQSEVAKRLGISQMHVSRLERQAMERLRGLLD